MLDGNEKRMCTAAAMKTQGRPLVVLIEDDNRVAPALAMLMEDWGYECVAARSPADAVLQLGPRIGEVMAIIADLSRGDAYIGRRSAEAIIHAFGTDIPRIVTTNEPTVAEAHGYAHVLGKPYEPEVLLSWLRDLPARRTALG